MVETRIARRTNLRVWNYSNKTQKKPGKIKKQSDRKAFCRLMLQGQVKNTLRYVDNANDIDGKHDITTDIIKKLKEKHPKAVELKQSVIIDKPKTKTESVIFEIVAQDEIHIQCKKLIGVQRTNTDWHENLDRNDLFEIIWHLFTVKLADQIATLARRLVTDTIRHDHISTLFACRLVPIKKRERHY